MNLTNRPYKQQIQNRQRNGTSQARYGDNRVHGRDTRQPSMRRETQHEHLYSENYSAAAHFRGNRRFRGEADVTYGGQLDRSYVRRVSRPPVRPQRLNQSLKRPNYANEPQLSPCYKCGVDSHSTAECRYESRVTCYTCHQLGHNANRCR